MVSVIWLKVWDTKLKHSNNTCVSSILLLCERINLYQCGVRMFYFCFSNRMKLIEPIPLFHVLRTIARWEVSDYAERKSEWLCFIAAAIYRPISQITIWWKSHWHELPFKWLECTSCEMWLRTRVDKWRKWHKRNACSVLFICHILDLISLRFQNFYMV